jgi:D-cysteine desulfhydrase
MPLKKYPDKKSSHKIWIKRDDYTGLELSGNKVRKLDFLIAEAIDMGCDHIITCGGIQSNHCRTAAFMARKMDLQCTLFLRGKPESELTGNLLLNRLAGVNIKYVTAEEYQQINDIMKDYVEKELKDNQRCYIIPEGGSNATGAWGYVSCFSEILDQIKKFHLHIDAIIVATGSGGTHAGLLIAKSMFDSEIAVYSVNVCDNADFFVTKIKSIIREFEDKYSIAVNVTREEIHVIDGFVGDGYGMLDNELSSFISQFARNEGIILDPVYSAKAFFGLKSTLERGRLQEKNIIFIHTGGIFGVFPVAEQLVL